MGKRILAYGAVSVIAAGLLLPTTATAQSHAAPQSPAVELDRDRTSGNSSLSWRPCRSGFLASQGADCAKLRVPLDYQRPEGKQITIALSRVRNRVKPSAYQGVMLVNPGGPGGEGRVWSTLGSFLPNRVAKTYDWIGFDPRGVGASRPALRCDRNYFGFNRPDYLPIPVENRDAWFKRTSNYARDCKKKNGKLLSHMTTVDSARDMDSIRQALGVSKINFYGFSYGTYLGQTYSTLFPQRVRRQVFDSNVNPRRAFYDANLDQDLGFQKAFELWFDWIAKYQSLYQLGATGAEVNDTFVRTQAQLASSPAGGKIGPSEWIDIFLGVGYNTSNWEDLATAFSEYVRNGRAQPLIQAYRESGTYNDDNSYAVYTGVQCSDAPWPRKWSTWANDNWATFEVAPLMTWANAWFNYPCRYWPTKATKRFKVRDKGVPPVLLVSGTLDAPTPYVGSEVVRQIFKRSRLLAIEGEVSHAVSVDGNRCVEKVVSRYLIGGRLPKRKNRKGADASCPAAPLPDPLFDLQANNQRELRVPQKR